MLEQSKKFASGAEARNWLYGKGFREVKSNTDETVMKKGKQIAFIQYLSHKLWETQIYYEV